MDELIDYAAAFYCNCCGSEVTNGCNRPNSVNKELALASWCPARCPHHGSTKLTWIISCLQRLKWCTSWVFTRSRSSDRPTRPVAVSLQWDKQAAELDHWHGLFTTFTTWSDRLGFKRLVETDGSASNSTHFGRRARRTEKKTGGASESSACQVIHGVGSRITSGAPAWARPRAPCPSSHPPLVFAPRRVPICLGCNQRRLRRPSTLSRRKGTIGATRSHTHGRPTLMLTHVVSIFSMMERLFWGGAGGDVPQQSVNII